MDLDDLRRKRMRLFAASDTNDQTSSPTAPPPTYPTSPLIGASAAAPIDLTTPAAYSAAAPLADLTKMGGDEEYARKLLGKEPPYSHGPLPSTSAYKPPRKVKRKITSVKISEEEAAPAMAVAEDVDVSGEAKEIRAFLRTIMNTKCACCGVKIINSEEMIEQFKTQIKMSRKTATKITALSTVHDEHELAALIGINMRCNKCHETTCVGCGLHMNSTSTETFGAEGDGIRIVWHCDTARVANIWFLLCGYDDQVQHNKPHLLKPKTSPRKENQRAQQSGVGYGRDEYDEDDHIFWGAPGVFVGTGHTLSNTPAPQNPAPQIPAPQHPYTYSYPPPQLQIPPQIPQGWMLSPSWLTSSHQKHVSFAGLGQTLGGEGHNPYPKPTMPTPFGNFAPLDAYSHTNMTDPSTKAQPYHDSSGLHGETEDEIEDEEDVMEDAYDHEESIFDPPGFAYVARKPRKRVKMAERVDPDDDITAKVLAAVTLLLPSNERMVKTAMDHKPPRAVASMLLRSSLLDKADELLRNGSLDNITQRGGLYEGLLDFVKALSTHHETCQAVVVSDRIINRGGHDLFKVSKGLPTRMLNEKDETSSPLAAGLYELHIAAKTMIEYAKANKKEFLGDESQQTLFLCYKVCDIADVLDVSLPKTGTKQQGIDTALLETSVRPMEAIDAWQKELSMVSIPDDVILNLSSYKLAASTASDPPIGRMRALVKEITRLRTSLPPGIFVRYGSSRLDCMKVLIIGPKGTPYENGLWEFDLFCPIDYPNQAPQMTFRTTCGGHERVNPNLYEEGKVCLSLLGTWDGEPWQPGVSTLLQVLVSIQAMIFCDEPYCNEPAYIAMAGTEQSKDHNRRVHPMTVKYAMLEWLEKDAGIWKEVVEKHFEEHGEEILTTVGGWVKDKAGTRPLGFAGTGWGGKTLGDDSGAAVSAGSFVGKLKGALAKLQ
ncbi:hypothetical protein LTR85_003505 [Meristemomyces frigidus]|nr:hypothetical protein LTR85_003505 [Meristemomyces frigidus]